MGNQQMIFYQVAVLDLINMINGLGHDCGT